MQEKGLRMIKKELQDFKFRIWDTNSEIKFNADMRIKS